MVNKTFRAAAVVTGLPQLWRDLRHLHPGALVLEEDETLPLAPGAHDLLVHAMALHWANDPLGQLIQARHALRPDGLLLAVFPGGQTLHELRAALARAEIEISDGLSPRVAPMGELRALGALLQRAGFALAVADSFTLTASYSSPLALMRELRAMGEGNALAARLRRPTRRALIARACEIYTETHGRDGRVPATFELIVLTGWAPGPGQPRPLRPGSARMRLADALGVTERPLEA
ncbi:MAG: methyltransferase domain-containing protein [Roseovarius sp.]